VYVDERHSGLRNPYTILGERLDLAVPARNYLLGGIGYRMELGRSRLDLGVSLFNAFNSRFREEPGVLKHDLSNYGGEILGRRIMFSARVRY